MSGFYGICRYDGAPVNPLWLERMKEAMAYYGPDGSNCMIEGPTGLGHLLLEVNPEDVFESQPVRGGRGLVVSAARLDNRETLLDVFNIPASEVSQASDGHLVSLAFDHWGEDLCTHLEGDWALAAWDARERRLILARDATGNAALYYYEGKGFIAFASSLKALLAIPGTAKEPDFLRIAEILVSWEPDAELTAYKGFRRLPWAHTIAISSDGQMHFKRYWSPGGREPLSYCKDEEYVEAFLEHYTRAVRCCLRTQKPVAAELSGGRDSGSVVALAAPILASQGRDLTTFTSIPYFPPIRAGKQRIGNEWELAHATAVMAGANVKHLSLDAREYSILGGVEHFLNYCEGPSHAADNHYWCQAILEAANRNGFRTVLSGGMGNATVSWSGNGSAVLALTQGYPALAFRLFFHAESNPWLTLKRQILKPILTPAQRVLRRLQTPFSSPWRSYSALSVSMARELNIDGRMRDAGFDPTYTISPLNDYHAFFFEPDFSATASMASEISAPHSLINLDPTANQSLIEFLFRVPDDQFKWKGQSSYLYKRAFHDRLPHAVVYGQQKGLQAADLGHRILRELDEFQDCLRSLEAVPEARAVLDIPLLHRCLEELVAEVNPYTADQAAMLLVRGLGAGLFLRRLANTHR